MDSSAIQETFTRYIADVTSGKLIASRFVKQAVARHIKDLEREDIYFDWESVSRVVRFFGLLRHSKGKFAGQPFELSPWQIFILGSLFGWKWTATDKRRFRTAYVEVVRKQGKSTLAAGIALYCMVADEEEGAEVYALATKREQAAIVHNEAVRMVRKSPGLRKAIKRRRGELLFDPSNGRFVPLGRDKDSLDGLNVHCAIIDEVHAIKDRELVEVIDSATGARSQPLLFMITTAGARRQGICYEQRGYCEKILAGGVQDDSIFAFIACLDDADDIFDEALWPKAAVNLGVSCSLDQIRIMARKARELPTAKASFARYCAGIWCESEALRWIGAEPWAACKTDSDDAELIGRQCVGGLDLAGTRDLNALLLAFPFEDRVRLKLFCWAPQEGASNRQHNDRVPYLAWAEQGYLKLLPGAVTDQDQIFRDIEALKGKYDIKQICFDRFNAAKLAAAIEKIDIEPTELPMTFTGLSAPMREVEGLVASKKLEHDGNPVLSWAMQNVVCVTDDAGNIRPSKKRSTERIDPAVALVLAVAAWKFGEPPKGPSKYEKEGILTL